MRKTSLTRRWCSTVSTVPPSGVHDDRVMGPEILTRGARVQGQPGRGEDTVSGPAGQALDVTTGDTRGFFLVPVDLGLDQPVPIRSQVERPLWAEITHILSRAVVYGGGGVGIGPNGELVPIPPHGPAAMAERFVSTSNDVMLLMCMLDAIGAMTDRSARASVQRAVLAEAAKIVSRLASGIPQRGPVNGKRNKETASA